MRRNGFGECYCHKASEAQMIFDDRGIDTTMIHATEIQQPSMDDEKFIAEVLHNDDGELVLYLEADTEEGVERLISELALATA